MVERSDLQDLVEKLESNLKNLDCEKKKLLEDIKKVLQNCFFNILYD